MRKILSILCVVMLTVSLAACAKAQWKPLFDYGDMTRPPTPTPAPTPTPDPNLLFANNPQQIDEPKIVVYKERHVLELYDGSTLVARIHVSLGTTPKGKKSQDGDGKTPEGSYVICFRNGNSSKFYKSLVINYPNTDDADAALDDGAITQQQHDAIASAEDSGQKPPWNTSLGGEIAICGYGTDDAGKTGDWTSGNIAVTNAEMDYLWQYVQLNTPVEIKP